MQVVADEEHLVTNAGLILPATLAQHLGLGELLHGAHVFEVIQSTVRTARQQGVDALTMIADRLRDPGWQVAPQLTLVNSSPR